MRRGAAAVLALQAPIMATLIEEAVGAVEKTKAHKARVEANKRTIECCQERRFGKPECPDYEAVCAVKRECDAALEMLKGGR